jgi:AcrR family transcriptional regulator
MLHEEILVAAEALLVETASEEAVSIRAIADRVGVTAPSIYRHFADKDALMFAVCERQFGHLDELMEKAALEYDDPIDGMRARGLAYVRFGLEHPEPYRMMFMTARGPHTVVELEGEHLTGDMVKGSNAFNHLVDASAAVLGRRHSPTAVELACEVWACVHGITALRITLPSMPWPPLEEQVGSYCEGLRARFRRRT